MLTDVHASGPVVPQRQRRPLHGERRLEFRRFALRGPSLRRSGPSARWHPDLDQLRASLKISFQCTRPGYIPITSAPIQCVRDPECCVVRLIGITSGKIPDAMFNATSERCNYEARNSRMKSLITNKIRPDIRSASTTTRRSSSTARRQPSA